MSPLWPSSESLLTGRIKDCSQFQKCILPALLLLFYLVSSPILNRSFIFHFSMCSNWTKAVASCLTGSSEVSWPTIKFIFRFTDKIMGSEQTATAEEWDLGAVIDTKTPSQCLTAVKQVDKILDFFRNGKRIEWKTPSCTIHSQRE